MDQKVSVQEHAILAKKLDPLIIFHDNYADKIRR